MCLSYLSRSTAVDCTPVYMIHKEIELCERPGSMDEEELVGLSVEGTFNPKTQFCEEVTDRNGLHCHPWTLHGAGPIQ